jgi:hypothetical protein
MRLADGSLAPGHFHKEILLCYASTAVLPGTAMTVKELPDGSRQRRLQREDKMAKLNGTTVHRKHGWAGRG